MRGNSLLGKNRGYFENINKIADNNKINNIT